MKVTAGTDTPQPPGVRRVLAAAARLAQETGFPEVTCVHILAAAARIGYPPSARAALAAGGVSESALVEYLRQVSPRWHPSGLVPLADDAAQALDAARAWQVGTQDDDLEADLLVFACLSPPGGWTSGMSSHLGVSLSRLAGLMEKEMRTRYARRPAVGASDPGAARDPALDGLVTDLVLEAVEGRLGPLVGREAELGKVVAVLLRRSKPNPILVGDPGVGKTAIVEGLAMRIAAGDVPEDLRRAKLWAVDVGSLVAGTRLRGDFEDRTRKLLDEAERQGAILFFDEVHAVLGAGASTGSIDLSSMLKPALARPGFRMIGATTWDEYRRHVEKDAAFARRFQPVEVPEMRVEETVALLRETRPLLEGHNRVRIGDEALRQAALLAKRLFPDRHLPDSAIDLIEEAAAAAAIRGGSAEVGADDVTRLASDMSGGTPDASLGGPVVRMLGIRDWLSASVVGQEHAVEAVSRAMMRRAAGFGDVDRPASFLFLGPPGVGKSHLAKSLARFLFGEGRGLVQVDLSDFHEASSVSGLIGAPPGYKGHLEGGILAKEVKAKGSFVLLLEDADKAHPKVLDVLLQLLEEGRVTDGQGERLDCSRLVVVVTANIPPARRAAGVRPIPTAQPDPVSDLGFRPELVNRFDEIVFFRPLDHASLRRVVETLLEDLSGRLAALGVGLHATRDAVEALTASAESDPRRLRVVVRSKVEDPVADLILGGVLESGSEVLVDAESGKVRVRPRVGAAA